MHVSSDGAERPTNDVVVEPRQLTFTPTSVQPNEPDSKAFRVTVKARIGAGESYKIAPRFALTPVHTDCKLAQALLPVTIGAHLIASEAAMAGSALFGQGAREEVTIKMFGESVKCEQDGVHSIPQHLLERVGSALRCPFWFCFVLSQQCWQPSTPQACAECMYSPLFDSCAGAFTGA